MILRKSEKRNIGIGGPALARVNAGFIDSRRSFARNMFMAVALLVLPIAIAVSTARASSVPSTIAQSLQLSSLASVTAGPNADALVSEGSPSKNYGASTYLQVDEGSKTTTYRTYIRFAVSGLAGSIQSVTLRVYCTTDGTANGPAVYLANSNWLESGRNSITWNKQPALLSGVVANAGAIATASWVDYNVTSLVTGNGTYTFALFADSTDGARFSSREGSQPPQLVITTSSTPTPTSTSAPLSTNTPTLAATATYTSTGVVPPTNTSTPLASSTPTGTPAPSATASPTATATSGSSAAIQHVFVVAMENHSYSEVWNTSSSPYITQLGNAYALATNYYAITHPSLPNYLDLYGGSNYGITTDCDPSSSCHVNAVNLADNLEAKGLTWRAYMESMPSPCYLTASGNYAPKHNPFVYFDDIRTNTTRCNSHDVPYTSLSSDLASAATTPNFVFITPNLCNDMHDCSVSTGDTWLSNNLPPILNSAACTVDKCLLILTWDEDDNSSSNHVLTIFAGSAAKTGGVTSASSYNHFSMLRTVEDIFGLPTQTSNDAAASPMTDLLR